MTDVALTGIKHGNEDGSVTEIKQGDSVSDLPGDVVKSLKEAGAIGEAENSNAFEQEKAALEARIKELEARIKADQEEGPATTAGAMGSPEKATAPVPAAVKGK